MKRNLFLMLTVLPLFALPVQGQQISKQELIYLTPEWDA